MISAIRGVCRPPCRRLFAWAQILVIWCGLCYDIDGAKNEMESCGDAPQSRRTPSGLSNSSVGMAGTDRTRDCAGERSCIRTFVFTFFRLTNQKSGDFPKELFSSRGTRAASDGLAPPTKPRAALKLISSLSTISRAVVAPPTKPRAALKQDRCPDFPSQSSTCTTNKGAIHERPYQLAALATSPALTGEAKIP